MSFIYSYFMSLGDFGVTESFIGNELEWLFWIIFLILTFLTLLIILNMVIAVMSASFERVQEENEAHIMRGRIQVILNMWFRLPSSYKRKFTNSKYLVSISIDPSNDPIENEDSETRIREDIQTLKSQQNNIRYEQSKTNFNVSALHKKMNKLDRKIERLLDKKNN